jgi:predicted nucleotidyltransferase
VIDWARSQPELLGAALVGSCARGTERDDSDIDLVFVTRNPTWWLETNEWLERFGNVRTADLEDYGLVQSRRVRYENGIEVEFGITTAEWLNTTPIDEGSLRVMSDGHRILDDKAGLFSAFLAVMRKDQPNQEEPIQIVPYDVSWPARFETEKSLLAETLGDWVQGGIHHVGSTAVPGLAVKPVIDIMVDRCVELSATNSNLLFAAIDAN